MVVFSRTFQMPMKLIFHFKHFARVSWPCTVIGKRFLQSWTKSIGKCVKKPPKPHFASFPSCIINVGMSNSCFITKNNIQILRVGAKLQRKYIKYVVLCYKSVFVTFSVQEPQTNLKDNTHNNAFQNAHFIQATQIVRNAI